MRPILLLSLLFAFGSLHAQTVSLGTLSKLDFCAGETLTIPYTFSGTFDADNVFAIQLSDQTGSFSSFTYIGRDTKATGNILATFSTAGSGYRVRVVSTDPFMASDNNGQSINVYPPPKPSAYYTSTQGFNDGLSFVDIAGDTIHIHDAEQNISSIHWQFDQDAIVLSPLTSTDVNVVYPTGGTKTGSITSGLFSCSGTGALSIYLFDCAPIIIDKNVHVVTGTESGNFDSVLVKSGAQYSLGSYAVVFVESGGSLVVTGNDDAIIYIKRGGSVTFQNDEADPWIIEDSGVSVTPPMEVRGVFHCSSMQFDYSQLADVAPVVEQPASLSLHQSSGHLIASSEGKAITLRITNILGAELLVKQSTGELDLDLSALPSGVYFAVAEAGGERVVRRVIAAH